MQPIVSVVIPTRNRPQLVTRAVQSALVQTFKEIEVIVVIDGSDQATSLELAKVADYRLRVIELPVNVGGAETRNIGVSKAQGQWIAFLDDDDEWLEQKLELQVEAANHSQYKYPIVACKLIARTPKGDFIWPKRLPKPSEPLSEYILARNTLFQGEGLIQSSMIFTHKELLHKVPFKNGLKRHQEWDWLFKASTLETVGIDFVSEPLAIWYREEKRTSISSNNNWRYSLTWIKDNQHLVTPRAYASFVLTLVSMLAAREGDRKAFWILLKEAILNGKPKPIDFLLHTGMWLTPQNTRHQLRALLEKVRKK